jgi:regulator of sigma E protease
MGVSLLRTAQVRYSWHEASLQGVLITGNMTLGIFSIFGEIISKAVRGEPLPPGLDVQGPVGITQMAAQALERGIGEYLWLMALISIFLAVFNILPIPALDGGKLLFLAIEKIKGGPVNQKVERYLTSFFFVALLALIILVTIKDITRLF